jgi:tetratricopeptide (TPR) repeat protein
MNDLANALLEHLLSAPSDDQRRQMLEDFGEGWPELIPVWGQQAWQASRRGDHGRALAIQALLIGIFTAAQVYPALAAAWGNHGHLLHAAGQDEAARQSWQRAIELYGQPPSDPAGCADASLNIGASFLACGDYEAALAWLSMAVAGHAHLPPSLAAGFAHSRLGDAQYYLARWDAAIDSYQQAAQVFLDAGQATFAADRWGDVGSTQMAAGRPADAVTALQRAVDIAEASGDAGCLSRALERLAYTQFHGLQAAEDALDAARRATRAAQSDDDRLSAHTLAATLCEGVARWEEAGQHYAAAHEIAQRLGSPLAIASSLEGQAKVSARRSDYAAARQAYLQALDYYQAAPELADVRGSANPPVRLHNELGQLAWEWGRPEEALQHYHEALARSEVGEDWEWAASTASALGSLHALLLHQPGEARRYYELAAGYYQRLETPTAHIKAARQRGDLALDDGDATQALGWYQRAAALARQAGDRLAQADIARAMAVAHASTDDPAAAGRSYLKAIRLYRGLGLPLQLAQAYVDLGQLLAHHDQHAAAVRWQRRAAREYRALGDGVGEGMALVGLGLSLFALQHYRGVVRVLRRAAVAADQPNGLDHLAMAYLGQGAAYDRLGRPDQALARYRLAAQVLERQAAGWWLPELELSLFGRRESLYGRIVALSVQLGETEIALEAVETQRSRAFLSQLGLSAPLAPRGASPSQIEQEQHSLARLRVLLAQQPSAARTAQEWQELNRIWADLEAIWRDMDPEYASMRQGKPLSVEEIRRLL